MLHHWSIRNHVEHSGNYCHHSNGCCWKFRSSDCSGTQLVLWTGFPPISCICLLQDPRCQNRQQQIHQLLHLLQDVQLCILCRSGNWNIYPYSESLSCFIRRNTLDPLHLCGDCHLLHLYLLHWFVGCSLQLQPPLRF